MNKEWILQNLIFVANGINHQNLSEIDQGTVANNILTLYKDQKGLQIFETKYWKYAFDFKNLKSFSDSVGKWWIRGSLKDFEDVSFKGIEKGIFTYTKIKNTKGMPIICLYTSEDRIKDAARF